MRVGICGGEEREKKMLQLVDENNRKYKNMVRLLSIEQEDVQSLLIKINIYKELLKREYDVEYVEQLRRKRLESIIRTPQTKQDSAEEVTPDKKAKINDKKSNRLNEDINDSIVKTGFNLTPNKPNLFKKNKIELSKSLHIQDN